MNINNESLADILNRHRLQSSQSILRMTKRLVQKRKAIRIDARERPNDSASILYGLRLAGLMKLGVIPEGGASAGPFRNSWIWAGLGAAISADAYKATTMRLSNQRRS